MSFLRKLLLRPVKKSIDAVLRPTGWTFARENALKDFYLHEYDSYEQYRDVQVHHNVRKLEQVWADEKTLDRVASIVSERFSKSPIKGLCHGARNGFEQNYLNDRPDGIEAIGTDISATAEQFRNSVHWDFHDERDDWGGAFDFVYTNSLDQSWKPKQAILAWLGQLQEEGVLIIEHTQGHGPAAASEMDPFGVRPTAMPYVLTMWFGEQISISHSVSKKGNNDLDAWLFVISKNVERVVEL